MRTLWRNQAYMLLWAGQAMSTLGSSATTVVYPLLVMSLTASPAAAGAAAALRALPYLLFSLPAGAWIDRCDRRRVMAWCDAGRGVVVLGLPLALAFGQLALWHVYAVCLVEGTLFVFFNVAEVASLPRVVPADQLPQAAAQNEAAFGALQIAGPTLGTWLWQVVGRGAPFLLNGVCYGASLACLLRNRADFRPARQIGNPRLTSEIAAGLAWLWRRPLLRHLAFLAGALNFVDAAVPLLISVVGRRLGLKEAELGVVFSVGGVGAVLGSLAGGVVQRFGSFGAVISLALWAQLAVFPGYAFASGVVTLALTYGLTCFAMPVVNVVQFSYRLKMIPEGLQGRVNSSFRLLAFGFYPLGAGLSGAVIERFGAGAAIAFFTAWLLALSVMTTLNKHVRSAS